MFYVYILKSKKDSNCYIGYTNNLKRRFTEHNTGLVTSTKSRKPFELVYYESYKSEFDAKGREYQLKRGSRAYEQLRKRISNCIN